MLSSGYFNNRNGVPTRLPSKWPTGPMHTVCSTAKGSPGLTHLLRKYRGFCRAYIPPACADAGAAKSIITISYYISWKTRSSADADNRLDAFSGQSRSTNMVPFHMLHIVSYCAIVTLSVSVFTIFVFQKFHDPEMGAKGHSRSLRVVSFDRLCMVSY